MNSRSGRNQRESVEEVGGLPRWIPPLVFAAVTGFLFREFIFSDRMLVGQDTLSLGYAARAFFADALRTTGFPLWNPQILGGTPFLESLAGGDSLYPPSLVLLFLTDTYRALGWKLVLHVFLAGCFMYVWIRTLGGSRGAALLSGLIYLLAPYLVSLVYPGHDGKLFVTALTPLLFATAEWMLLRRDLLPGAALGGVVALVILTTHFQMAYFLFGAVGLYMLFRCVQVAREGQGWYVAARRFGLFLGFSILGAGAAGIQLVPAVSYVTQFSRRTMTTTESEGADGVAYSASWSLHPEEVVGLIVPEFVGNSSGGADWASGTYWGRNPFKTNHEYLGVAALLLAMISFTGGRLRALRWFLLSLGVFALLFALGLHTLVWKISYAFLPGISLFRAPSMAIFLTGFSVSTLAALGVDRGILLISEGKGGVIVRRSLVPLGLLTAGWLLALTGALPSLWVAIAFPDIGEQAVAVLEASLPGITQGFLITSCLAGLVSAVWWAMDRKIVNTSVGLGLIAVMIVFDQGRVDDAFIQTTDFDRFAALDGNAEFLVDRSRTEEPFRVLSLARGGQDVTPAIHGLELAAGHHPNDLARYRELIGMLGSGMPAYLVPPFHPNIMGILNIRYIVWPDIEYGSLDQWIPSGALTPVNQLGIADGQVFQTVYDYPALPRARIVGEAIVVPEAQTLEVIRSFEDFDPTVQAVLNEDPPFQLAGTDVEGSVTWVERTPNRLVFDVDVSGPALVVLAENWFPAWTGWVDGAESPVLRADHTLRAVAVPEGRHRVELRYESDLIRASLGLSLASILLLAGIAMAGIARARRSPKHGSSSPKSQ